MEREALKLALEALKEISRHATTPWEDEWCGELADETLTAINALALPVQEPLTCQGRQCQACETNGFKHSPECIVDTAKEQGWSNAPPSAQPAQEPDVVMHCDSHTWTINNPPPKGSGDVNLYYAAQPVQEPVCPECKVAHHHRRRTMTERLMEKLARLGAEAGIKQMTPEIYKFSWLLNEDKNKIWDEWVKKRLEEKHPWVDLTDSQIEQVYYDLVKIHRGAPMPWGQINFGKTLQALIKEKNNAP